jgi:hypothetical protein
MSQSGLTFGRQLNGARALNAAALPLGSPLGSVGGNVRVTSGDLTFGDALDVQTTVNTRTGERGVYITPQGPAATCAQDICVNGPIVLTARRRITTTFGAPVVVDEVRDECDGHIIEQVQEAPVIIQASDYDIVRVPDCIAPVYTPIIQSIGVLRRA